MFEKRKSKGMLCIPFFTLCLISTLLTASCRNKLTLGAQSKEELVRAFVTALAGGNADEIRKCLVRKQEYIEAIHPHTPEAQGIGGKELWETMLIHRRDALTGSLMTKLKGKTCNTSVIGEERKKENYGPLTFYREVPVSIVCGNGEKPFGDKNRKIFGIVVEKYGVYKVLGIFGD